MAQNLSGRSGPVMGRSGPVGAGQGRSVPVPVPVPLVPPVPAPTGADRYRWQTARNAVILNIN